MTKLITGGVVNPPAGTRNTFGGAPILAHDQSVPVCQCGEPMVHFLQFDLPAETGLPPGSHFLAFMCPEHNEINEFYGDGARPERFWEQETGAFALILNPPGIQEHVGPPDPYLVARELLLEDGEDNPETDQAKVGGVPFRINCQVEATCGCGSPMVFFAQLGENYDFPQQPDAPEQPDGFSSTDYGLFLGNIVYFLACQAQCSPYAVTAILDN